MAVEDLFFEQPEKIFKARELARLAKISHPTALKALDALVKADLVEKVEFGYKAKTSEPFKRAKKLRTIQRLYGLGLVDFLKDKCTPNAMILFGSASRGEDTENSDIDLFLEAPEHEVSLKSFEGKLKRKINLTFGKMDRLNKTFLNNLANGFVLDGGIKL